MSYYKTGKDGISRLVDDSESVRVITASETLVANDSGSDIQIGTDALVVTLPAVATVGAGISYKFTNIGADGAAIMTISPAAADAIHGTITLADSIVELSGVVNKDLINTKATATTGNTVHLVSGVTDWYVKSSTGIFASE